jgi:hypothetical protein
LLPKKITVSLRSGSPIGLNVLFFSLLYVTLFAYLAIWSWILWTIWGASGTANVDSTVLYVGSAVGGTLSGFFAASLGIRKSTERAMVRGDMQQPPAASPPELALGVSFNTGTASKTAFTLLVTLAIWSYAAVGLAALCTVFLRSGNSPESVKAIASAFSGLVLALFNQVFRSL